MRVGYESYGTLSPQRDNVVLVPHYFSGNSHVAGKYAESDPLPGYWDMIIGPGKAVDTNQYFVISVDSLCNANADPLPSPPAHPVSIPIADALTACVFRSSRSVILSRCSMPC